MRSPFRATGSSALRGLVLLGAVALQSCHDDSDSPLGGNNFPVPARLGGLAPVEGSDLLDDSFAAAGVFETYDFVERLPIRVVVDRLSRPSIVGVGVRPRGLRVERLTEAGTNDATFGTDGLFLLPDEPGTGTFTLGAADCQLDAFDRILLFSTRTTIGDAQRAVVVRLDPDGVLDPSYGDQGRVVIEPTPGATETLAVSLGADPHGGVMACATELWPEGPRMILVRIDESGALDATFGEGGVAHGPEDEASLGVRAVSDAAGRVVVAGTLPIEPGRAALWRFDADGSLDPGFGVDGLVTQSGDAGLGVAAVDVATDAAGRIVLLGQRSRDLREIDAWPSQLVDFKTDAPPVFDAIVWRFLPDGSRDPGFDSGGASVLAFSGPYYPVTGGLAGGDHFDAAAGLFLDDAGRIVIAGWSDPGSWETNIGWATFGPTRPFLVRLDSSGALDPDFHGVGHAQLGWDYNGGTNVFPRGHPTAVTRDARGRWLLAGGSVGGSSQRVWRVVP